MSKPSSAAGFSLAIVFIVAFFGAAPQESTHPKPFATATAKASAAPSKRKASPTPTPDPVYGRLRWREVGPAGAGGRVAAVAGTAADPALYYLGAAGGGVWKSEDGGTSWDPVFTKERVGAIGAVEIDPKNKNVVWVGTGEANPRNDVSYGDGIYKSTNGGKTWRNVGLKNVRHIARIAIDPKNPNIVVVAAFGDFFADSPNGGIWRTSDGGRTWQHTLYVGPQSGGSDLAMDPQNPNIVFAGMWQCRRVPWTLTSGGPNDGLYRSQDGGKSWTKLTGRGLPGGLMGRIGLAIAPSKPRRVFALIQSKAGVLWRSDDSGDTWKLTSSDTLADQRPFYFSHIAVDPSDANHVFAVSEMLAESKNGGKKFKVIADEVHVDYHAIWIAPNNAKRIIVGEDGGYALSLNGGDTWSFAQNIAIGQVYHVAADDRNPYWVCAPLQDNNGFCGPSNSLSPDGILNSAWHNVVPGDGMWIVPDPSDNNRVWGDLQDGSISIFDFRTGVNTNIRPFYANSAADFALYAQPFRFNWDSPIAFAPWDPHTAWLGANVVFQTTDDGVHWKPISPDLTRNIKSHQQASGGPISLDVSAAEFSDNILDIEGSTVSNGEIWVGTDDGLVQLTRDGGDHWTNVTPRGVPQFARVETVAPSPFHAGTAFAIFDDHRSGNYKPYLYATTDFGKSWRKITSGLPGDQYVRTVRPDIRNANMLYAGTEQGVWVSYDGGAYWHSLKLNLPAVSVRDIRIQPTFDDVIIATHGRAVWILDDAHGVQDLTQARAAGAELFPLRTAYEYHEHRDIEDAYENYRASNPPNGVIINFYQAAPQKRAPSVQVLDANGRLTRTISGTRKVKKKSMPLVSNDRSLNRVVWDFRENGPVLWTGAPNEDARGPRAGAVMPPGTYSVRVALNGRVYSRTVDVRPDPRLSSSQADYEARYQFLHRHYVEYSDVDVALNALDALKKQLDKMLPSLRKSNGRSTAVQQAEAVLRARARLFYRFTANFHNDEDSIGRPGALREDLEDLQRVNAPPLPASIAYAATIDRRYREVMQSYNEFSTSVKALNAALSAAGAKSVPVPPAIAP
ncbi:MAG: hypothetical protein DLM53_05795 [Candidatus Eremiobacter antarcticus]|nr:hypothetical protein [Candidatus Eremiobacteraeota bacterium]PZR62331.1 MAG: hypothetical protein DLM53_05795 [Candidatus Eremiobacter sp. RRmetagenome_bin22]